MYRIIGLIYVILFGSCACAPASSGSVWYQGEDPVLKANEDLIFELRKGVDVVFTWGTYGRDFWHDTAVERTFDVRPDEDVLQYFLPFPPVRNDEHLNLSGQFVHAEQWGVGDDRFWVVIYDPPKGQQVRGHIAFQTFLDDPILVPTRYVVMVRPGLWDQP